MRFDARMPIRRVLHEDGQTMAEYAVILSVIALAVLVALGLLSGNLSNVLNSVADAI